MLVIEGPDGIGKSTFCRKLVGEIQTRLQDCLAESYPRAIGLKHNNVEDAGSGVEFYRSSIRPWIVQNRFHLSEIVYAEACDRPCGLSFPHYFLVNLALQSIGGMVVVFWADEGDYAKILAKTGFQDFDSDVLIRAAEVYRRATNDKAGVGYRMSQDGEHWLLASDLRCRIGFDDDGRVTWPGKESLLVEKVAERYVASMIAAGNPLPRTN